MNIQLSHEGTCNSDLQSAFVSRGAYTLSVNVLYSLVNVN